MAPAARRAGDAARRGYLRRTLADGLLRPRGDAQPLGGVRGGGGGRLVPGGGPSRRGGPDGRGARVARAARGVAGGIVVAGLLRPPDAAWLSLALFAAALVVRRWRRPALLGTVAAATILGWLPWVAEAYASFGGLFARLRAGSAIQGGTSPRFSVLTALRSVNGPVLCRPCTRPVPLTGALLWLGGLTVVAVALAAAYRRGQLAAPWLAAAVGLVMAVPYLFLVGYSAPRFLLPSYGLLALTVAEGLLVLAGARQPRSAGVLRRRSAPGGVLPSCCYSSPTSS